MLQFCAIKALDPASSVNCACASVYPPLRSPHLMAIHAHKKGEESNDRLQQRFKQQVQKSGIVPLMRRRKVLSRKPSTRLARLRALKRESYRQANRKKKFYSNM